MHQKDMLGGIVLHNVTHQESADNYMALPLFLKLAEVVMHCVVCGSAEQAWNQPIPKTPTDHLPQVIQHAESRCICSLTPSLICWVRQ